MRNKKIKYLLSCLLASTLMSSCIQDEALNVEAAIDGCTGKDIQLVNIDMEKKEIQLYVSKAADFSQINIAFDIPQGASIAPNQAAPKDNPPYYDFSQNPKLPRDFTVVSEDGEWKSTYKILVWQTDMPKYFGFETLTSTTPFHILYEDNSEGNIIRRLQWCSGNPGFQLTGMAKNATEYPTVQSKGGALQTLYCAKLETKSTGSFGDMVKMPLAAGNLFIGSFDLANALKDAKASTKFGYTFYEQPTRLTGWYKYQPGPVFTDQNKNIIEGKKDACDIYAVLYETDEEIQILDGSNCTTSDRIICIARNPEAISATDQWTYFDLPFEMKEGKSIDQEKLAQGVYKLAVVFSSSADGAEFKGAVGSTLYIDEVTIHTLESN